MFIPQSSLLLRRKFNWPVMIKRLSLSLLLCIAPAFQAIAEDSEKDLAKEFKEVLKLMEALKQVDTTLDRDVSLKRITNQLDRNAIDAVQAQIDTHLKEYPDDAKVYGQLSRLIMKQGGVTDDSMVGYRFTEEADKKALAALETSLKLEPSDAEEQSRLGYLHAVQGRYKKADKVFATISPDSEQPIWLAYNKAIMEIGNGSNIEASELLDSITRTRPQGNAGRQVWSVYRSAWKLRKSLALEDPSTDPVEAIREGKVRRVAVDDFYDAAVSSGKTDKPVLTLFSSGDSGCGPCIKANTELTQVADALADQYDLVYTSIEPWNDVNNQHILRRAFNMKGLPSSALVKENSLLASTNSIDLTRLDGYLEAVPKIQSGEFPGKPIKTYDDLLQLDMNYRVAEKLKTLNGIRASAVAYEGRQWTSGTVGDQASQQEANAAALARCENNVKARNMKVSCTLFESN